MTTVLTAPATAGPKPSTGRLVLAGSLGQAFVGGSAAVSGLITTGHLASAQAVRYALAFLLLLGAARLTGRPLPRPALRSDWVRLAAVSATGLVLFSVAMVHGARHAEPAVFGVAVAGVPLVLAVLGPLLAGQRPRVISCVAALVLTGGVVLIQSVGRCDLIGLACAVVVLACEAAFTLIAVPVLARSDPWVVSVHTTWMAAVIFFAWSLADVRSYALSGTEWLAVGYLSVLLTAVAFVLWYSAVRGLGAAAAGLLTGVAPVAAAVGGVLLGGPAPSLMVWVGILVVLAGITLGLAPGLQSPRREGTRRTRREESVCSISATASRERTNAENDR